MHESRARPVSEYQFSEEGLSVKSILGECALVLALLSIVPANAAAQPHLINRPIFGFYLGESKQSLLLRAKEEGVNVRKEKTNKMLFPDDAYVLDGALDKSQLCKSAAICFFSGYVVQIDVELTECSFEQWQQVADEIGKDWGVVPDTQKLQKGRSCTFTSRDALIVMGTPSASNSPAMVVYVHRRLWSAASDAKLKTLSAQQF